RIERRVGGVVREVDGTAEPDGVRLGRWNPCGGQHEDLVTPGDHPFREITNLDLNAANVVPCVRTREGDPHVPSRSDQPGWNRCQSGGDAEIARSKARAISRVIAVASSRRLPVRGTSASGWRTQRQPVGVSEIDATTIGASVDSASSAGPAGSFRRPPNNYTTTPRPL